MCKYTTLEANSDRFRRTMISSSDTHANGIPNDIEIKNEEPVVAAPQKDFSRDYSILHRQTLMLKRLTQKTVHPLEIGQQKKYLLSAPAPPTEVTTESIRRDSILQLLDGGQKTQKKETHDVNFDADRLSLYADIIMSLPSEPSKKEKEPRLRLVTRLSTMMRRGRSN